MFVCRVYRKGFFQKLSESKTNFFTSLWNKPVTRDERIKGYIPEVLEESLVEEKAIQLDQNSRDIIVELGHKVVVEIEKKSPTSRIAPYLNKILKEYGTTDVIRQRPLSYLIYPTSSVLSPSPDSCHELVLSFADNFREMIEEIERSGCSIRLLPKVNEDKGKSEKTAPGESDMDSLTEAKSVLRNGEAMKEEKNLAMELRTGTNVEQDIKNEIPEENISSSSGTFSSEGSHEPPDLTLFVKIMSGMALANISCSDFKNAVKCVDTALLHAKDTQRIGGLYGMKAGILVRLKKFEEAATAAKKAIEVSHNLQGFLQGAYALHQLNRIDEELELLEQGKDSHPMNQQIVQRYDEVVQSLPEPLLRLEVPSAQKN